MLLLLQKSTQDTLQVPLCEFLCSFDTGYSAQWEKFACSQTVVPGLYQQNSR